MKHIIFGGSGFIGCRLAVELLEQGGEVLILDRLPPLDHFKEKLGNLGGIYVSTNLDDFSETARNIELNTYKNEEIEIWHLAANSDIRKGIEDPHVDFQDTLSTTLTAIAVSKELNTKSILFASSSAIFGDQQEAPIGENNLIPAPASNYGNMKLASENSLKIHAQLTEIRTRIYRFPNVIGWPTTHGVIFDFYNQLKIQKEVLEVLGDGNQTKPYIHVNDLVDIMIKLVTLGDSLEVFNIAPNDEGISVKAIAEAVTTKFAPSAKIEYQNSATGWFGDVPRYNFDVGKLLSFMPDLRLSSRSALTRVIEEI